MSKNDISFEGGVVMEDNTSQLNSLTNHIQIFELDKELKFSERNIVLLAIPLENRDVYILEKRPGCDLAGNIISKQLKSSFFSVDAEVAQRVSVFSFLNHFETQPLKIHKSGNEKFYEEEVILKTAELMNNQKTTLITFCGSIDFSLKQIPVMSRISEIDVPIVIKISPILYLDYVPKGCRIVHLGLDRKFVGGNKNFEGEIYNYLEGPQNIIDRLRKVRNEIQKVFFIFDCQVLSPDYFQGISVPFPFSFSKNDFMQVWREVCAFKEKICGLSICQFNPTVEELRSSVFLIELLYLLISEK